MRQITVCLLWVFATMLMTSMNLYAEIYKWTVNGKVHYSDRPQLGKKVKRLKLDKLSTHKAVIVRPSRYRLRSEVVPKKLEETYSLSIQKPIAEQTFMGIAGDVQIEFGVSPVLKSNAGHMIRYRIDDQDDTEVTELQISLSNIDRGSHKLYATIVDNQGLALSSEVSRIFYVRRPSSIILQNLKNSGSLAPNMKSTTPVQGTSAPPANP